jgi:hypothetical protein
MVFAQVPVPNRSLTFTENVALIVITALVVGFAVPVVKGFMDRRRDQRQRTFEVNLDRASKVIDRQYELLKELSKEAWEIVRLTMPLTYYRIVKENPSFEAAWERYEADWFPAMLRLRALVSQSRRLVSPEVHQELVALFDYWFRTADPPMRAAVRNQRVDMNWWRSQHEQNLEVAFSETERVLGLVAQDIGIVRTELPGPEPASASRRRTPADLEHASPRAVAGDEEQHQDLA